VAVGILDFDAETLQKLAQTEIVQNKLKLLKEVIYPIKI
jgi:hypothetical protein